MQVMLSTEADVYAADPDYEHRHSVRPTNQHGDRSSSSSSSEKDGVLLLLLLLLR